MGDARHGNQHIELCTDDPEGVKQTIDGLTVDEVYEISFSIAPRPGITNNNFRVTWNGEQIGNAWFIGDDTSTTTWTDVSVLIKAEYSDGNELIIEDPTYEDGNTDGSCSLVDAVSVSPCSCPDDCANTDDYNYDGAECEIPDLVEASSDEEADDDFNSSTDDCVVLYSECNYTGESMEVCDTYDCFDWAPMSVVVPRGKTITLYTECE